MCSGGDGNHQATSRKQNKTDLTTWKICVPLVPVEYVDYIYWLSETSSGPARCTASCSLSWKLVDVRGTQDTLGKSGEVAHGVLVYSTEFSGA